MMTLMVEVEITYTHALSTSMVYKTAPGINDTLQNTPKEGDGV
jgi:hypothetical protein